MVDLRYEIIGFLLVIVYMIWDNYVNMRYPYNTESIETYIDMFGFYNNMW